MADKKDSSKSPRNTNGPVVKTGPTAGQNRSRNDDGAWRKKRSDAGETKKKSGCFITTAVCDYKGLTDDCNELRILRQFRDEYLLSNVVGVQMVEHYYQVAPAIADRLVEHAELENVWIVICGCLEAIADGRFEDASSRYAEMVNSLECKFGGDAALP